MSAKVFEFVFSHFGLAAHSVYINERIFQNSVSAGTLCLDIDVHSSYRWLVLVHVLLIWMNSYKLYWSAYSCSVTGFSPSKIERPSEKRLSISICTYSCKRVSKWMYHYLLRTDRVLCSILEYGDALNHLMDVNANINTCMCDIINMLTHCMRIGILFGKPQFIMLKYYARRQSNEWKSEKALQR